MAAGVRVLDREAWAPCVGLCETAGVSDDVVGREPVSRSHRLLVRLYFYRWPIAIVAAGVVVAALVLIGGVGFIVTLLVAALMLTIWVTFITT